MIVNTNFCKGNFLFNFFFKYERYGYREGEWEYTMLIFFLFEALSLDASILKYSSTSSIGVSYFFPVALGVLF